MIGYYDNRQGDTSNPEYYASGKVPDGCCPICLTFNGSAGASDSCSGVPYTGQTGKRRIGGGFDSLDVRFNHSHHSNLESRCLKP
jgi:hypothetical protein